MIIPPFRFATVESNVYRGAYPTLKNLTFLRRLKLKTIVSLIPEKPIADLQQFCEEEKIQIVHFKVKKYNEEVAISSDEISLVLNVLIDPSHLPVYIHDLDGANITGLAVMCLRKLQNWSRVAITNEFTRFVQDSVISRDEQQFLDKYEGEIKLPEGMLPNWLWKGQKNVRHPSVKIQPVESPKEMPLSPSQIISSVANSAPGSVNKNILGNGLSASFPLFNFTSKSDSFTSNKPDSKTQDTLISKAKSVKGKNGPAGKSKKKFPDLKEEIEFAKSFTWHYKTEERFKHEYFDILFLSESPVKVKHEFKHVDDVVRASSKIIEYRRTVSTVCEKEKNQSQYLKSLNVEYASGFNMNSWPINLSSSTSVLTHSSSSASF